ncbi:uncharacterized protein LOC132552007 [Ylistrum balloti]|uniref:uncharacterized protein LOC132552007 n=1 Tax=Ylistrum balloti TaxID=509963 RepID=UPI0029059911|nr:uncharacterized protein LOC132552007 [Ylistrum balloti]
MLGFAALATLFTFAVAQHHHHGIIQHGNTYDHPEQGDVRFFYDSGTNYLISSTHSTCYFMALDASQQSDVHSSVGMEKLEIQMMTMISGGEDELTNDQIDQHSHLFDMACHNHKLFLVGSPKSTTPAMSPEN